MHERHEFVSHKLLEMTEVCSRSGLPLTVQRRVIMEALAQRSDHPSADQLYEAVSGRLPGVSRTTVYRALETFVRQGLIQRIDSPRARGRFDADTARHHHLHCTVCDAIADLYDASLDRVRLPDADGSGFQVHDYTISFTGRCPRCAAQQPP